MCQVLGVARSGFYAWVHAPLSPRAIENERLLELIQESYMASGRIYGSPRIFLDLREAGEYVGHNRVARIMRVNGIRALRGYKAPRYLASVPSAIAPNRLQRQFTVARPDVTWVTDIERHEALSNRAVVKGHGRQLVAADWLKLRAA
jgi:putative transposase